MTPGHVLLVEDDLAEAHLFTRILRRGGYVVTHVATGEGALAAVLADPPDIIILDAKLPGIDGVEVCRQIKANEATALIPITIFTGAVNGAARRAFIKAGADDFLEKSLDTAMLVARIETQMRIVTLVKQLDQTEQIILTLARLQEARDIGTERHVERVVMSATRLASALDLDESVIHLIRLGAHLHDIGKVGIPDAILLKPAPLTDVETATMQQHTVIGERILADMRFAAQITPIVRGHHERWDGQGYPDGLVGEAIPIGARIVKVVDVFDAMTSERPYHPAAPSDAAVAQLRLARGTAFDPRVVDAFLPLVEAEDGR